MKNMSFFKECVKNDTFCGNKGFLEEIEKQPKIVKNDIFSRK